METIEPLLADQPFFRGLDPSHLKDLATCASREKFSAGQFLCRAEEEATTFFLILQGRVSVEIFSARRGPVTLQTMGAGDVLGWLGFQEKPFHWHWDARAVDLTRVLTLEVGCIKAKCEADHDLGYEIMKRFVQAMAKAFRERSLQLTDMFQA